MEEQLFNPDKWLNLGLPGAALFIVLIIIVLMFRQQGKSIDKLCEKLDNVTDAFSESNITLREVIISNDKDQKELLRHINNLSELVQDMQVRVVCLDTRLYEMTKKGENITRLKEKSKEKSKVRL